MLYRNIQFRSLQALTIIELIIALAIITIIFAAVLPQFRVIQNGWDSRQANTEVVQNGRVLIDHINRNLSKAVKITAVSESTETDGFIVFQDNDGNNWRYDINAASRYVEFGIPGNLSDLAGPVDSLVFTCYDACNLDTPLDIATADINEIRFVTVQTTLLNTAALGRNITFIASAYLRTNDEATECWQNQDIGDVGADGSANESDGTWTIEGSGVDIWDNTDEFHYASQSLSGDGQIIARVNSVENTNAWAKAGVMIRETLDGDSKHAMMVVTPGNGTAFQRRTSTGGSSDHTPGSAVTAPYWVRLVRSGNTFTGYESADGAAWTLVGSASVIMAADVYIGLCVTSHSDGDLCTAEIDNVSFSAVSYEGFTSAKAASDTTSITISTIGTVVTSGSWVNGLTHAVEAGSNRLLIFIAHVEDNDGAINLSSVTYGGQAMAKIIDITSGAAGNREYVVAYRLNEAGIAAATSGNFAVNWGANPPDSVQYYSVFLQNVNQTTPLGATASNATLTGATITTAALATGAGDMVIDAATCGSAGSYTVNNSFAEAYELGAGAFDGVSGYKSATGVNETPSVTHSTTTSLQALIGFVVQVNEESGIEGDLLIAAVATDGGTSSSMAPPAGENWNEIDIGNFSNAVTLGAWWKLAEASESASHRFTWSGGQQAYGWMMRFTGHNPDEPVNAYSTYGHTSINPSSPDVDTTVDNCLILRLGAFDNDNINVGNPGLSGHTPITMDRSSNPTVEFVAAGAVAAGTGTITPALPAGIVTGDILLLCLETANQAISINNPNGGVWTEVTGSPQGVAGANATRLTVFWSRYNGTQGAPTTTDSGDHQIGRIIATRGTVDTGDPWDVTAGGVEAVADTTGSIPGATTTVANTLVVAVIATALPDATGTANFGGITDTWVNGDLTGVTERTDNTTNSGNGGGLGIATGEKATIGAYGNTTVTCGANSYKAMMSIALKPPQTAVSGGAGYIGQASSGNSGTSNFTLTSSNASRTLTIAIAPADANDCQGSILP